MTMQETTKSNYDTLAAVRRLTEAGMPEAHAEAVVREQAHLIENELATKTDIAAVQGDIEKLRLETRADIEKLRQGTRADIENLRLGTTSSIEKHQLTTEASIEKLRLENKTEFESIRANIEKLRLENNANAAELKADLIKWMFGANIALVAVVIAAVKLL